MSTDEKGNQWFLQPPGKEGDPNQQTAPPPGAQQSYQSQNTTNPFNKLTQPLPPQDVSVHPSLQSVYSPPPYPPPQGSPYPQQQASPWPQQQGGSFSPPQFPPQQGTPSPPQQGSPYPQQPYHPQQQGPYSAQQNTYAQPGPYSQGYPQQQGSPYSQPGYPQQGYGQPQQRQFSDPNFQPSGEASSFYGSGPPPAIQPGPGPGGPGDRGFFDSALQVAGVHQPPPGPDGSERGWFSSSKNPLDPPPKMFKRPAPGHYAYTVFRPVSVLAVSEKLQDGFALMPPVAAPGEAHPFISHDITEDDWHKFLKDFQKTAHLSASDRLFQGMGNSFMKDKIPSATIQQRMAENKLEPIGDYLMAWNHYFFRPRRITVILAKGTSRFSGESDDYPPDVFAHKKSSKNKKDKKDKKSHNKTRSTDLPLVTAAEPYPRGSLIGGLLNPLHKTIHDTTMTIAMAPHEALYGARQRPGRVGRHSDSDSDSSSSSSDSDSDCRSKHKRGLAGRRADREYRREERRARREVRREGKHGKVKESIIEVPSGKFRLVICYWDGQREIF